MDADRLVLPHCCIALGSWWSYYVLGWGGRSAASSVMVRLAALLFAGFLCIPAAWAISDPAEALPNPAAEARAVAIGRGLRCLVCQNESIEDSGADLARDLRAIVRQHVAAGETDRQVTEWVVARYGDFVRLRPPFNATTSLLWASPVLALLIGGGIVLAGRRSIATARRNADPALALTAPEQARLKALLDP